MQTKRGGKEIGKGGIKGGAKYWQKGGNMTDKRGQNMGQNSKEKWGNRKKMGERGGKKWAKREKRGQRESKRGDMWGAK